MIINNLCSLYSSMILKINASDYLTYYISTHYIKKTSTNFYCKKRIASVLNPKFIIQNFASLLNVMLFCNLQKRKKQPLQNTIEVLFQKQQYPLHQKLVPSLPLILLHQ